MHFSVFLRSRYRMGVFWGVVKFQIFLGVLEIPAFFVFYFAFVCVCCCCFFLCVFFFWGGGGGGGVVNGRYWA